MEKSPQDYVKPQRVFTPKVYEPFIDSHRRSGRMMFPATILRDISGRESSLPVRIKNPPFPKKDRVNLCTSK